MTTGTIETKYGTLEFTLNDDTPNTSKNFVELIKSGYYDGLTFHRVIPGFVVQGGCPRGTGTGGPGYRIACETDRNQRHQPGALSMAHAGKNTGGSQFFIVLTREQTAHLDGKHTVFGQITKGLDLINKIQGNDKMIKVAINSESPVIAGHTLQKL